AGATQSADHDAPRRADCRHLAGLLQLTIRGDRKRDDRVAALVGHIGALARGVEGEVARRATLSWHRAERAQQAGRGVDGERGDRIVAAVGDVHEATARLDQDLGGGKAGAIGVFWDGGQDLELFERAVGGTEGGDGHVGLAVYVGEATVWMEAQVARRGAGVQSAERRVGRLEVAITQAIADDLVDALVAHQQALAGGIEGHEVGVWPGLRWPRTGALVLAKLSHRAEPTLSIDGQDGDAAVLMVGDDEPFAARVRAQVAGLTAAGRLVAQLSEHTRLRIDAE